LIGTSLQVASQLQLINHLRKYQKSDINSFLDMELPEDWQPDVPFYGIILATNLCGNYITGNHAQAKKTLCTQEVQRRCLHDGF
jgi:hypothetical protein